jgi:hypothetical protein
MTEGSQFMLKFLSHEQKECSPWKMEGEYMGKKFIREKTKLSQETGRGCQ